MRECEEILKFVQSSRAHNWISRVACSLQAAISCTRAKHAEKLKHHASWRTTREKVQTGHSVSLRLELAA